MSLIHGFLRGDRRPFCLMVDWAFLSVQNVTLFKNSRRSLQLIYLMFQCVQIKKFSMLVWWCIIGLLKFSRHKNAIYPPYNILICRNMSSSASHFLENDVIQNDRIGRMLHSMPSIRDSTPSSSVPDPSQSLKKRILGMCDHKKLICCEG